MVGCVIRSGAAVRIPDATPLVLALAAVLAGCQDSSDGATDSDQQPPKPIGDELMSHSAGPGPCGNGHLYRDGRQIQSLCFDQHDDFSYENRGTLTPESAQKLDEALAAADLGATDPVNFMGSCGTPDAFGTETLWVAEQSVTFDRGCPIEGVVPLYEHVVALSTELGQCGEGWPELLESIEPGCRSL